MRSNNILFIKTNISSIIFDKNFNLMDKTLILNQLKNLKKFASDKDFAQFIGISPQNLAKWYERNTFDIDKVFIAFPEVSAEWLLTGCGDMLKKQTTVPIEEADSLDYENQMLNQRIEMQDKAIEDKDNMIELLSTQLEELRGQFEDQLKAKDAQISAKDNQISSLLNILANKTC